MILSTVLQNYRPLVVTPDVIFLARGYNVYRCNHQLDRIIYVGELAVEIWRIVGSKFRLVQRALRLGIQLACLVDQETILLVVRKAIWAMNIRTGASFIEHRFAHGARPLNFSKIVDIAGFEDGMYYGEYWDNLGREEVGIYHRTEYGQWRKVFSFAKGLIEHIHNIVPDPINNCLWILTGDFDIASGIWCAKDGFADVRPLCRGSQEYRCAWLHFSADRAFYATDSQLEPNYLICFDNNGLTGNCEQKIMSIPGSSIYGVSINGRLAFSTAVEPGLITGRFVVDLLDRQRGPGITSNCATLYYGDPAEKMEVIFSAEKDCYPFRLFEFGALIFPHYTNGYSGALYCYAAGVKRFDNCTLRFQVG